MTETAFIPLTSAHDYRSDIWVRADVIGSVSIETLEGVTATWVELLSGTAYYVTEKPAEVLAKVIEAYNTLALTGD